jgi:hypothetical protein
MRQWQEPKNSQATVLSVCASVGGSRHLATKSSGWNLPVTKNEKPPAFIAEGFSVFAGCLCHDGLPGAAIMHAPDFGSIKAATLKEKKDHCGFQDVEKGQCLKIKTGHHPQASSQSWNMTVHLFPKPLILLHVVSDILGKYAEGACAAVLAAFGAPPRYSLRLARPCARHPDKRGRAVPLESRWPEQVRP